MRISYVINTKSLHSSRKCNLELYRLLCSMIQACVGMEIVDSSPDIVHIFGSWNMANARHVEKYRKRCIPVVFTPLDGLAAIMSEDKLKNNVLTRLAIHQISHGGTTIQVVGQMEKEAVEGIARNANVHVVLNPVVTCVTDEHTMAKETFVLYEQAIDDNDNKIRQRVQGLIDKACIDDDTISHLCSDLLYIRERLKMQNVPQHCLESLSRLLTTSDYDESKMRESLETLHIYRFASYVMALLGKSYNLTEGFMPVESLEGKVIDKIENVIIQ